MCILIPFESHNFQYDTKGFPKYNLNIINYLEGSGGCQCNFKFRRQNQS